MENFVKGKTTSGFEFNIPAQRFDNMELLDTLSEFEESENSLAFSKLLNLLLSKKEKKELYDTLRKPDGTIPIKSVSIAVNEIFSSGKKEKN